MAGGAARAARRCCTRCGRARARRRTRPDRLAELVCSNSLKIGAGVHRALAAEGGTAPPGFAAAASRRRRPACRAAMRSRWTATSSPRRSPRAIAAEPLIECGARKSHGVAGRRIVDRRHRPADQRRAGRRHRARSPAPAGCSSTTASAPSWTPTRWTRHRFRASRYGKSTDGTDDYLNCPFDREQYERFVDELLAAQPRHGAHRRRRRRYFEACLPIEELARRGRDTLRFGPMKPMGLTDPRTGRRP